MNTTISNQTAAKPHRYRVLPIGFALFAMFFGAGNIIYPLNLGADSGQHLVYAILGFLLFGVGAPFLGLFATSLFHGNYEAFFNRLGKINGFLIITFLMLIIGPLSAMPRTEVIVFNTLESYLPVNFSHAIFSAFYCAIVFIFTYKETRFMNVLGYVLSPIKLISFSLLIILGLLMPTTGITTEQTALQVFTEGIVEGYSTVDLLAAFFFCTLAYHAVKREVHHEADEQIVTRLTMKACFVGAACLSIIYIGFMLIASLHGADLEGVATDKLIAVIAENVLGRFGAVFVCLCITFACLATAMALAEVTGNYLYKQVFRHKLSKTFCVLLVCFIMFLMTNLGFDGIMALATPILLVIYPALIVLCIVNILYKLYGFRYVKVPVLITIIFSLILNFYLK